MTADLFIVAHDLNTASEIKESLRDSKIKDMIPLIDRSTVQFVPLIEQVLTAQTVGAKGETSLHNFEF